MTSTAYGYKFNFDSEQPIPAHDPEPSLFSKIAPTLIDYLLAWDVVIAGAWAIQWVYYGGYGQIVSWFIRICPSIYNMVTTGQL